MNRFALRFFSISVLLCIILAYLTYYFYTDTIFLGILYGLFIANGTIWCILIQHWHIAFMREESRKFRKKIVSIASALVVAPCALIVVFSLIFFNLGVQTWFKERIRTVMNTSTHVADTYLAEHKKILEQAILNLARSIDLSLMKEGVTSIQALRKKSAQSSRTVLNDLDDFLNYVSLFSTHQALIFEHVQDKNKIIAQTDQIDDVIRYLSGMTTAYVQSVSSKRILLSLHKEEGKVVAVVPLSLKNCFLLIMRNVDPEILRHVEHMKRSSYAYQRVFDEQSALIKKFIIVFVLFSCILLLSAILLGLSFARRLTDPIAALLSAADAIRVGNLKQVDVTEGTAMEELALLMRTFNAMVHEMHTQKEDLICVNHELEARSQCLINVLSSVSSGVLGVDPQGLILSSNERAQTLLATTHSLEQRYLQDVCPEFWDFVKAAHLQPGQQSQIHMTLVQDGVARIYALSVRSWSNGAELTLTFDDITELVAAQKRSAWEDVARRVAHEVKNPLTPISLSAQRLKRRFSHCVDQPEILEDCVNTIVKQVAYIDQLISEFSSFARMAEIKLTTFSLCDTLQRIVNFHQHAYAAIVFTLEIEKSPPINHWRGDEGQLERALTNLLKNSIEAIQERQAFCTIPGRIRISVYTLQNGIQISIHDNGVGFSHETPLFFCDPYVTTKKHGTGLGLAIVQRIISEHQGTISLKPCIEGGAIAVLTLPFLK